MGVWNRSKEELLAFLERQLKHASVYANYDGDGDSSEVIVDGEKGKYFVITVREEQD